MARFFNVANKAALLALACVGLSGPVAAENKTAEDCLALLEGMYNGTVSGDLNDAMTKYMENAMGLCYLDHKDVTKDQPGTDPSVCHIKASNDLTKITWLLKLNTGMPHYDEYVGACKAAGGSACSSSFAMDVRFPEGTFDFDVCGLPICVPKGCEDNEEIESMLVADNFGEVATTSSVRRHLEMVSSSEDKLVRKLAESSENLCEGMGTCTVEVLAFTCDAAEFDMMACGGASPMTVSSIIGIMGAIVVGLVGLI